MHSHIFALVSLHCTMTADAPLLHGLDADALFARAQALAPFPVPSPAWEALSADEMAVHFPGWKMIGLIGRGGMAAVYRMLQPDLGREVAVKVLPQSHGDDPVFAERFRREARTLATLRYPSIVTLFDSGQTAAGHLYFVMEFVDGEDLGHRLRRAPPLLHEAFQWLDEVSAALVFAHSAGFIHRDLKPSNILLTRDGRAKLADFGLAGLGGPAVDAKLTLSGIALGTFDYAAPEQTAAHGPVDCRSDIYSLGVLAYEVLTGRIPRGVFDPPSHLNPHVDPAVDAVILTALQSDPARRYRDVAAFRTALTRAQDARANRLARERKVRRQLLRRARLALLFALLSAAAVAAAAYGWSQQRSAAREARRARESRDNAEKLVSFLTEQFVDKLKETGRNELLEEAVAQAEHYFARLPPEDAEPSSLIRRARVQLQRAYVHRTNGDWDAAVSSAAEARTLADRLARDHPDDPDSAHLSLNAVQFVGTIQMIRGQFGPALQSRRDLRVMAEKAAATFPTTDAFAVTLVNAWRSEGEVLLNLQRYPEDRACQEHARRMAEAFLASHPSHSAMLRELASVYQELGSLAEKADADSTATLQAFQQAVDISRTLVKPGTWSFDSRYNLCGALARLATTQLWRGDLAAAEATVREAITIVDQLEARTPGGTPALYQRRFTFILLARVLKARGRTDAAAAAQSEADAASTRLDALARDSGN